MTSNTNSSQSPFIPESAPFSTEQRMWLNGFLAGMPQLASSGDAMSSLGIEASSDQGATLPVTICYGSQSGTAEELAYNTAEKLKALAVTPNVISLEEFEGISWEKESHVLFVTSTWGDGDMPDNAVAFWNWLSSEEAPKLPSLQYSVLGLGDTNYTHFCKAGELIHNRLSELEATSVVDLVKCDTDYEDDAEAWQQKTIEYLQTQQPEGTSSTAPVASAPSAALVEETAYGKKNPFGATLLENIPLNHIDSQKDTRHITLSLAGSGLQYEAGDALGVYPQNCDELVDSILAALNCTGREVLELKGDLAPIRYLLLQKLDLFKLKPAILQVVQESCNDSKESKTLEDLLASEEVAKEYLASRDLLDVLESFPSTSVAPQSLIAQMQPLGHRLYSISSSPNANTHEVHLTVGVVKDSSGPRMRKGTCSTFLAERLPLGTTTGVFVHPSKTFRLPSDTEVPVIMVGPGTGIAPFRAFLQERKHTGSGPNWLFFGDQKKDLDFLYQEQLEELQTEGVLTRLDLAFSRDQKEKVYVQNKMKEAGKELFEWLEKGAYFYVCGDAKRMAKDVDDALHAVIAEHGNFSPEEAINYVEAMKKEHRYERDVY
jgi:sulfite reductase (NADPH) flavoprotein alpha-component